jgi:ATP-dependent DNA helicase PIF1
VIELRPHTIKAEIVTQGAFYMTTVIIPRIDLVTDNKQLPFQFRRRQFPVQLAYSMTIHKSQGQSFERMGIYIDTPLFTHGQLYVALSRVGKAGGIFMHIVDKDQQKIMYTDNVIYHSALQSEGYRIITNSEENRRVENSSTRDRSETRQNATEHRDTYDAASTSSDSDSDSDSEHSNSRELTAKQTSILNVKTYIRQYAFPHSITGSWAIIPFILDVFGIHHDRAQGIKFYSDIAQEGLYEKLKEITINSFKERKVIFEEMKGDQMNFKKQLFKWFRIYSPKIRNLKLRIKVDFR